MSFFQAPQACDDDVAQLSPLLSSPSSTQSYPEFPFFQPMDQFTFPPTQPTYVQWLGPPLYSERGLSSPTGSNSPPTYPQTYYNPTPQPHLQPRSYQQPQYISHPDMDGGDAGYAFFAPPSAYVKPLVHARANSYPGPASGSGTSSFHSRHASYPTAPLRWIASYDQPHNGNANLYENREDYGASMYEAVPPQYEMTEGPREGPWEWGSSDESDPEVEPKETVTPFISKLAHLLSETEYTSSIRWNVEGTAFVFAQGTPELSAVFARFFRHSNCQSFIRQLNIYGFTRLPTLELFAATEGMPQPYSTFGTGLVAFSHPLFFRDPHCRLSLIRPKTVQYRKGPNSREKTRSVDLTWRHQRKASLGGDRKAGSSATLAMRQAS